MLPFIDTRFKITIEVCCNKQKGGTAVPVGVMYTGNCKICFFRIGESGSAGNPIAHRVYDVHHKSKIAYEKTAQVDLTSPNIYYYDSGGCIEE